VIFYNFLNLFNFSNIIFFSVFIFLINKFLITTNIRKKFFLFLVMFFITLSIGLYYNLDGMVMMFAVSELSVVLIFITMFSQLYSFNKKTLVLNNFIIIIILSLLNYNFYATDIIKYNNFYSSYSININDFYYIYNCYFEKQILLTIFIIFIITLYSVYFILLYFNFKKIQNFEIKKLNNINFLKKQNIIHQSNYKTTIRMFQNIK